VFLLILFFLNSVVLSPLIIVPVSFPSREPGDAEFYLARLICM
jgi:hypothetical protein